ncbi:hypothetical protein IZ6_25580 [Terrihabitans soli]|uniref:Uncharacterized protein n=1 Tax=Terrihabitans soli TaxID=708113 RepID=A0A6S6QKI8_9HYPH|nr:hypothetical protein [Terrihabitans soli]BCJ91823.1 hypothetical protein IZ6_25580 [Terrihabitans soli]
MKIESNFAILDVKAGRDELKAHIGFDDRRPSLPAKNPIPVTITGVIDGVWGEDDGISREFSVKVDEVKLG